MKGRGVIYERHSEDLREKENVVIQQTFWYLTLIQDDHAFRESEHLEREQKESSGIDSTREKSIMFKGVSTVDAKI